MQQKAVIVIIMSILCLSISYAEEKEYYRLPKTIRAEVYHLNITVNMDNDTFEGNLLFDFRVLMPTKLIEMHKSSRLKIKDQISLTLSGQNDKLAIKDYKESNDLFVINLEKELTSDLGYRLNISKFEGVINTHERGLYSYEYVDGAGRKSKYAAALLKPVFARNVFPCLDEPAQKAKFKISITRPNNYNSVSNGLRIRSTQVGSTNMTRDDFEDTPYMSTYLVSFVISQLSFSNRVVNVHRALAQKRAIKQGETDYFIDTADKILKKFEQYVGIKYPLKQLYHVAVPMDLSENMALATWGLIVYKESFILSNQPNSFDKEIISEVVAHQIAHLYFENLITFKWWGHNWLHEGLSDFLSYKLLDELYPKWVAKTNFKFKVLDALHRDSFPFSEALEGQERSPIEVHDNTHIILRPKGAAMIYMLESIVTPAVFKDGIKKFLNNNAYKNVVPSELYFAMDYVQSPGLFPRKLELLMWTWNTQSGYPIVQVTRNYNNSTTNIIELEQQPFNINQRISRANMPTWIIPINYAIENNYNFSDLEPKAWLLSRSKKIRIEDLKSSNSWIVINKQGSYFYRVNYDQQNWDLIIKALIQNHTSIDVFHRMQLIDDCNALAQGNIIPYDILLAMLKYLPKETEYGPLSVFKKISVELKRRLSDTDAEKYFDKYIGKPVETLYNQFKKEAMSSADHILSMKLKLLFTWLCELNHTRCMTEARLYYGNYKRGRNIPPELEEQVFCTAIRMGEKHRWNGMFTDIRSSKSEKFSRSKFVSLACTEDKQFLEKYLNYVETLSRDRLALALVSVSAQGPTARGFFSFLLKSIPRIIKLIPKVGIKVVKFVIDVAGMPVDNRKDLLALEAVVDAVKPKYRYLFEPGLEFARNNIQWREQHVEEFTAFLKESISPISDGSTHCLASLNVFVLVLYTLLIIILN